MHSQNVSSTRKKAGTCALEPHTLSPKALGRHPVFRHGKVRQPTSSVGPWGTGLLTWFHMQSWPERVARSISKQTSVDSWFCSHCIPCTLQPDSPSGKWKIDHIIKTITCTEFSFSLFWTVPSTYCVLGDLAKGKNHVATETLHLPICSFNPIHTCFSQIRLL